MAAASRVLVYGGKGALGSVVVSHFKAKNWVGAASLSGVVWGCFCGKLQAPLTAHSEADCIRF